VKYRGLDIDPSKIKESVVVQPKLIQESTKAFKEHTMANGTRYLLPRIEAIHAGTTRNNTRYLAEKLRGDQELKSGVYSWLHPYAKPVIYNHDVNTEASGRIQTAAYSDFTSAGRPGIIVVPKITSESAINDILGGRLLTVSIGATTDAAVCSVCGTDILEEGWCGHEKGGVYDGITAEWIVGNVWFDELSWVNVPADQDAMIISDGESIPMSEAFAGNGREFINLGKNTTEWLVPYETALAEGLVTKEEKGDSALTEEQIQALQQELEAAKAAKEAAETELATAKEEKATVEAELETTKETLTAKESELEEKTTELTSVKEELEATKTEVETLTSTKESLEAEKATLETTLGEEKQAHEQTVEENSRLATEMHKMTAERVVDLRISLGKETSREEAIEKFAGRSTESLNDSLADLLVESTKAPVTQTRTVERVQSPGAGIVEGTEVTTTENKDLSAEDVLMRLFGSKK
jgi:hypothetical protein